MSTNEHISSIANQWVKAARLVRDGADRSSIFVEGVRLVEEALDAGMKVSACFMSTEFGESGRGEKLRLRLSQMDINNYAASPKVIDSLSATKTSQGVILICDRPKGRDLTSSLRSERQPLSLYLHEISDPSNLGACIRSAAAAGVRCIFVSSNSADPYSPKALRASMGASFKVYITEQADLRSILIGLKPAGAVSVAADIGSATEYTDIDWTRPTLLVVGSEAHGLPKWALDTIDQTVRIPMADGVESLNLAVSASIIIFEALRQQRLATGSETTD